MKLEVWHAEQPDGTWVATCEQVPGWFCFGDSFDETHERSQAHLVLAIETADVRHHRVIQLQAAA